MDKEIKDLLENEVLGEDVKTALQEAFDNKVKAAEQKLREDYSARYANDKAVLVENMDRMLTDAIRSELSEFAEDRSALIRQRAKLSKQTMESKRLYVKKVQEHMNVLDSFMTGVLKEEMSEFVNDRKTLDAQRREMAKELRAVNLVKKSLNFTLIKKHCLNNELS
jgi:hypothetical protein